MVPVGKKEWNADRDLAADTQASNRKFGVMLEAFRKRADGSWTSIRNSDVSTPDGAIRVGAGMDFKRGITICGVDVAGLLDEEETARRQSRPPAQRIHAGSFRDAR